MIWKNGMLAFLVLVLLAGCERKAPPEPAADVAVSRHQASGDEGAEFSETYIMDTFPAALQEEGSPIQTIDIDSIVVGFHQPAESFPELKEKLGHGSFDEWRTALGISKSTTKIQRKANAFSVALVPEGGSIHLIESSRYPALVVAGRWSFSGRIWDLSRGKTWAITGDHGSGPDEAGRAIEVLRGMIPAQ